MVKIGNSVTPGPITEVSTANFVGDTPEAPQDGALVGPADFSVGTGQPNKVYYIANVSHAETLFGRNSTLAEQCGLALSNTARPIYAIAPATTSVTSEDMGLSATGTFANAPHPERTGHYSVTVDSTDMTPYLVMDTGSATPASDEIAINPVTGEWKLDATPSTSATADYDYLDYGPAFDELRVEQGSVIDFIAPVQEHQATSDYLVNMVDNMEKEYEMAQAVVGAGTYVDTTNFTQSYDNSRVQMYYPTRRADGSPLMGSIVGTRAGLALNRSATRATLTAVSRLYHRLNDSEVVELTDARVNPIYYQAGNARIGDDLTTVSATNFDEEGYDTGFSRLVMDEVILAVVLNEERFIGSLNTQNNRNSLSNVLESKMTNLQESEAIEAFNVQVSERDAQSANVDIAVETVKGLRNIHNEITAGVQQNQPEDQEDQQEEQAQSNTEDDT